MKEECLSVVDGIQNESSSKDQTPQATPMQPVKDKNKENFTPETENSDEWKGLPWTPADVSTIRMNDCMRNCAIAD